MMDRYIKAMKDCGADAWEITDIRTTGWEFYFIRRRLDQNRAKDVEHITLKAYKYSDDGEYMGSASAEVAPTISDEELKKTAADLVRSASLVKNRPYELNPAVDLELADRPERPMADDAEAFLKAMAAVSETDTEYMNSYEIFVDHNLRRLITSEGMDISERSTSATLDLVVNAARDGHEIELYRLYDMGECDPAQLKSDVEELMRFGRDRLRSEPTPNLGRSAAVFSTDAALSIYEYFLDNLDAAYVVRGMSPFETGSPVAKELHGDRITFSTVREMPGSPCNFACDAEGAPIRDAVLIDDGVVKEFVGSRMFSQYLGLEDSFAVSNWSVSGGTGTAEEIRSGEFLEIVEFSDFQVDSMTGDIFGEIRLAYYHDGKGGVRPVSGGSVSGSMADNIPHMKMSAKTRRYANAEIPVLTRLEDLTIAGAEK